MERGVSIDDAAPQADGSMARQNRTIHEARFKLPPPHNDPALFT
jgi:hypothetical protein